MAPAVRDLHTESYAHAGELAGAIEREKTMKTQKENGAVVLDAATVAAVTQQIKREERKEAKRFQRCATEPFKVRYIGKATLRLIDVIRRHRSDLSETEPPPQPEPDSVCVTGTVLDVGDGDRIPDALMYESLSADEAAGALSVQDALRLGSLLKVVNNEAGVLASAEQVLADRTEAVAAATRARESASAVRDEAVRRLDVARSRVAEFVKPLGDDAEEKLRAILASTVPAPRAEEPNRAFIMTSEGPRAAAIR